MRKLIVTALLSIGLIIAGIQMTPIASATVDTNKTQTILVAADKLGNNKKYRVYQLKDNKMVATKKSLATHSSKRLYNWKAQAVKIDGKTWWKIGENQYFKSNRVHKVNVEFMKKHGVTDFNYAN